MRREARTGEVSVDKLLDYVRVFDPVIDILNWDSTYPPEDNDDLNIANMVHNTSMKEVSAVLLALSVETKVPTVVIPRVVFYENVNARTADFREYFITQRINQEDEELMQEWALEIEEFGVFRQLIE